MVEQSRWTSPLKVLQQKGTGLELSTFPPQVSFPSMVLAYQHLQETSEPSSGLHQHQHPSNVDQPPPTPRYAFAPISLPPAYLTSTLDPLLVSASGSEVVYRPFPVALPEHQGITATIVPGDTPAHLFIVRLSYAPGDYRVLAFPTGALFTSVNDVLHAVRVAVADAGMEPEPEELEEAKEGSVRLDSKGRWTWTGFVLGSDGVWELNLV
ncbi:hypothetical protein BDQ12DRAFT_722600 [Crucibulum laeve]|uniref:Uncharacterized protein n=1 Tax=Crucibulum laeve TaxID=68775 RepID=A0A5C3M379_9AGAR|nr:hypothetical protein BDQ12DRAFT_722600 [Crucibulum laeve]